MRLVEATVESIGLGLTRLKLLSRREFRELGCRCFHPNGPSGAKGKGSQCSS